MKNNRLIIILLLVIIVALSISHLHFNQVSVNHPQKLKLTSQPVEVRIDADRLARIDTFMNEMVSSGIVPNIATFVAKDGKIVHYKTYGYRDLESRDVLEKDDIFRIASQTKAITSVALMTLYEEGKFLLDDPVSKYIPEFKDTPVLVDFNESDTTYTTRPAKKQITIRHLLTHTSGIHYGILGGGIGGMMYAKENIPAVNSLDDITIEKVVKKIAKMPLMFDPGEKFMYGMNLDVIGYLIEVLSGERFDDFMRERVLEPLGMNDSYFYLPDGMKDRLVTLYSSSSEGLKYNTNESYQNYPVAGAQTFLSGGAGLCGPIEDYGKFCQMLLNKGEFNHHRILSRKTIELMTMNQIGHLAINSQGNKFGLGFELFEEGGAAKGLGTIGSYKWGGMYYTDYLIDPKENIIMLVYTNVQPYWGPNIHEIFRNLVYQSLE